MVIIVLIAIELVYSILKFGTGAKMGESDRAFFVFIKILRDYILIFLALVRAASGIKSVKIYLISINSLF